MGVSQHLLTLAHAQGTVAKKPYNPILGETFACYWDLPDSTRTPPDDSSKVP